MLFTPFAYKTMPFYTKIRQDMPSWHSIKMAETLENKGKSV